jgi:hypothetical protein
LIERGAERCGYEQVVVAVGDQAVVGERFPYAPFEGAVGAFADFALAGADLVPELACVGFVIANVVSVAAGFDDAEEVPAEIALEPSGELDGDDFAGLIAVVEGAEGFGEEGGEAGADAGGVDDDPDGVPVAS